jgi:hypothetical protein
MKKSILLLCSFGVFYSQATTITVSNNTALPGSPGQYTTVQAAVNAAFAGDTVLIHGSPVTYNENVTTTKKLVFIGPGYNPQTSTGLTAKNIYFSLGNNTSNTVIMGIYDCNVSFNNSTPVSNITFSRNYVASANVSCTSSGGVSNVIIEQNFFTGGGAIFPELATGVEIRNNLFASGYYVNGGSIAYTRIVYIRNNSFMCAGNSILNLKNGVIENNIFYERNIDGGGSTVVTSTFNNNLTYSNTQTTLPFGTNVGSGNLSNIDPMYINSADCGGSLAIDITRNFRLNIASPAANAGTDGTDIGITGGVSPIYIYPAPYPITGEPPFPQVREVTIPVSSVPAGGTLNVNIKARKRN